MAAEPAGRWRFAANWTAANLAIIALWSPWFTRLFTQVVRIQERFWAQFPSARGIQNAAERLYLFGADSPLLSAAAAAAIALGIWVLRRQKAVLAALLLLALFTPLLVLLISFKRPIFILRILLWTGVPAAVLFAAGVARLRPSALYALCFAAILVAGFYNLDRSVYSSRQKPRWRYVAQMLSDNAKPDSVILAVGGRESRQLDYYFRRKTSPVDAAEFHALSGKRLLRRLPALTKNKRSVWVVRRRRLPEHKEALRMLKRRYRVAFRERYGSLEVVRLEKKKRRRRRSH
jgi:hypothetical protein